jgi:hypothetical protein
MVRSILAAVLVLGVVDAAGAQQNPSPMVEHTREHPRLAENHPPGQRTPLELGRLFVPKGVKGHAKLLFFFHGGAWVPEVATAGQKGMAVVLVQAGAVSSSYEKLFEDPGRFARLIAEAQAKSGLTFSEIDLGGWSAGCGALRKLLNDPTSYERVHGILCIDGIHTNYANGKPGPEESVLDESNLQNWLRFGRDAMAGKKRLVITHSEIFPGTYASTTETADWLLREWELRNRAVVNWGPMKTQMLSEAKQGGLTVAGFAGNSAPDHLDELHSLPEYLKWLEK